MESDQVRGGAGMNFTNSEKLAEIEREIAQRHRVYRRLIDVGRMKPNIASRQIAILHAIAEDYRAKVKEGPLFERIP
jgi:hypothetical protein